MKARNPKSETRNLKSAISHQQSAIAPAPPFVTIEWVGGIQGHVRLLDQTLLPTKVKYRSCARLEQVWEAIRALRVRGAPAIGIAAAMGLVLGVRRSRAHSFEAFRGELAQAAERLAASRPTAVNLSWALRRMLRVADEHRRLPLAALKECLLREAVAVHQEDAAMCRAIGAHGAPLLPARGGVLTHCNAGALATGGAGTALAVITAAHAAGKALHVYADETRPLLQGARLTTWELMQAGVPVTLICDNMAAQVMREGRVRAVIVGADRIAANGDAANKIGTYGVAVLAKAHGLPFYVAAPTSTFDPSLATGAGIPIEQRGAAEVTEGFGRRTAPYGVAVYCPAFDVTPAKYIAAIITERGLIIRPNRRKVLAHLAGKK